MSDLISVGDILSLAVAHNVDVDLGGLNSKIHEIYLKLKEIK